LFEFESDEAEDGFFALHRDGSFIGVVKIDKTGAVWFPFVAAALGEPGNAGVALGAASRAMTMSGNGTSCMVSPSKS
jgi:hypothetical protein